MKFKITLSFLFLLNFFLTSHAYAQNNDWTFIANTDSYEWKGKLYSGSFTNTNGKKNNAYSYIYQKEDIKKRNYEYGKIVVDINS